jgi:prepilin-type N-terminal cleavage/methylation domain-containing protein
MKTPSLPRGAQNRGFTLIELLVVISIIAILAGFALPVFTSAQKKGRITDSLSNCKQIALALRMYAGDNDGIFPNTTLATGAAAGMPLGPGNFSNDAFETLMPKYSTSKKIFLNKGSAYCKSPAQDQGVADANRVLRGQNDWVYLLGLSDTSDARWPLIATATKSASDLTYAKLATSLGGVWNGSDAVVGFCDGSARPMSGKEMDLTNENATFIKSPLVPGQNMLTGTEDWLGTSTVVLAPQP